VIIEQNSTEIRGILNEIKAKLIDNSSPMLSFIGERVVLPSIKKNFEEEGRPTKWVELAPWTQRERVSQGYGPAHPILQRSGELMRMATVKDNLLWQENKNELKIICVVEDKWKLHFGEGRLPARPFFMLQKEDEGAASKEAGVYVAKELQRIVKG